MPTIRLRKLTLIVVITSLTVFAFLMAMGIIIENTFSYSRSYELPRLKSDDAYYQQIVAKQAKFCELVAESKNLRVYYVEDRLQKMLYEMSFWISIGGINVTSYRVLEIYDDAVCVNYYYGEDLECWHIIQSKYLISSKDNGSLNLAKRREA